MHDASSRLTGVLLCFLPLLFACNTYRVSQTSLVPAAILTPAPSYTPGFDASLTGSYNMGSAGRTSAGNESSLYVSRGNLLSALEYSGRVVGGRLMVFNGFNSGASRVTRNTLGKPDGSVWGVGPGMVFRALGDHPKHRLTFDFATLFVVSPSRVLALCTDCALDDPLREQRYVDRSVAFMLTGGLQHRVIIDEQLRAIWGVNLQTSVTNTYEIDRSLPGRSKVNMGAPHPTFMAGVEWSPTWWATLQPALVWIAPPSPSIYLPTVMLSARFNAPRDLEDQPDDDQEQAGLRVLDQDLAKL